MAVWLLLWCEIQKRDFQRKTFVCAGVSLFFYGLGVVENYLIFGPIDFKHRAKRLKNSAGFDG